MDSCSFEGCDLEAEARVDGVGPLCPGHRKQLYRRGRLEPLRGPHGAVSDRARLEAAKRELEAALHHLEDAKADLLAQIEERGGSYANADSENDGEFRRLQRAFYDAVDAYAIVHVKSKGRRRRRRRCPRPARDSARDSAASTPADGGRGARAR